MDEKEKYVANLIRWLVNHGVIMFINTAASALTIGPYGLAIGPALSAAIAYFDRGTEQEQAESLPAINKNEIVKIAFKLALQLAIDNIHIIIKICKDIINLLKRLFEVKEESTENIRSLIRFTPHV